jgi:nicotinamidase-related amidase
MQSISIPNPSRSRALFIIDVQPGFVSSTDSGLITHITTLIQKGYYDVFVLTEFQAPRGSLWDTQTGWTFPLSATVPEISSILDPKKTITIAKSTKSVFIMKPYLAAELRARDIEEIHSVGFNINDCVLATANDAFDLGFYSYVIEEAAGSSEAASLRDAALVILRNNEMTNHSELIKESKIILK